jgi:hypothetical protein
MAQTTAQVTQSCGEVEISTNADCSAWYDASGETQSVTGMDQTRMSGEAYTLEGDTALIGGGKREPMELEFSIVYTETDAETYERVRTLFELPGYCGFPFCVRWSPRGGDAGEEQITTASGILVSFSYPPLDASSGGVIMGGFTVKTPYVTTANGGLQDFR